MQTSTLNHADHQSVPLRRQYLQLKSRFPDTILLFRLGDFYETFDDDAELTSRILDIVLTGRDMGKGQRVPMAGIPYHSAEGHIARLVAAGHKVAICEQIGNPTKGRGLVDREVTRVVTPGTVLDPQMLDDNTNNYIAAVVHEGNRAGIAVADISTGQFQCTEIERADEKETVRAIERELGRLQPKEVVVSANREPTQTDTRPEWLANGPVLSRFEPWKWRLDRASDALQRHYGVPTLDGFGCAGKSHAVMAAGGLLQYLGETQLAGLSQITELASYSVDDFMTLDAQTRRNLELSESARGERRNSLIAVLDQTRTPMGARLLRQWINQPLLQVELIRDRLDNVDRFVGNGLAREELRRVISAIGDVERLTNRAISGISTPRDLGAVRSSLAQFPEVNRILVEYGLNFRLPENAELRGSLAAGLVDEPPASLGKSPTLRPGFATELDSLRSKAREAREWIAGLERHERERTGIRTLKVGYNRVFGYYLELSTAAITSAELDRAKAGLNGSPLPDDYIPKQTLTNGVRYFTPKLKEYETIVLTADETSAELEAAAFRTLVQQVADERNTLLEGSRVLAQLDVYTSMADVAARRNYVRPEVNNGNRIEIRAGRHPTLEATVGSGDYVPNDATVDCEESQIVILTGPNMAGKSSWLRQVALTVLLAQIGSFVPAKSAKIGLVDRIFTRIGAQDDISAGQSTFMVEMLETANILNHASPKSLVLLDEIGRGTSTYDGLAIAQAIVEFLHNSPRLSCRTLFATHYHELTALEQVLPRVQCYRMDVHEDGDEVVFLHHVVPGGADRSYGIHVAQLAGVPRGVISRAREILLELEKTDYEKSDRGRRSSVLSGPAQSLSLQLTLFGEPNPIVEELKQLDVESMSPLEVLTKLYELHRQAKT